MVSVFYVEYVEVYSASMNQTHNCGAQNSFEVFSVIVPASHRDENICETEDLSIERHLFFSYSEFIKNVNAKISLNPVVLSFRPAVHKSTLETV